MDFLRCQNKLRAQMQTQGNMTAIRNLARAFRSMDDSEKGVLSKEQFERALGYCHMYLNNQELETIMSHYDLKHDGTISYEEFLTGMRGSLNARRKLLVGALFSKLAGNSGSTVTLESVQNSFNPDSHPHVRNGIATRDEIGRQFVEIFDPSMSNGVSISDFEAAFSEISAVYEKDNEFVGMVTTCFDIAEEPADISNTASRMGSRGTTRPFSLESRSQLALERRREAEEERKARLLDPKARMIGIDVEALNRQVEEKRTKAAEEQDKDKEADRQALLVAERGMLLERQVELQRRQRACDDAAYNHAYQRKQFRREYDLSNPDNLKNDLPVRVGDSDPRLGVSSIQVLHGEDPDYGRRVTLQKKQQRDWCVAQTQEKESGRHQAAQSDRLFAARQQEFLSRAVELDNIQQRQQKEKRLVADEFNHAMVVQKKEEERQKLLQDAAEEIEELRCNLDSALLSELHPPSALGPHRKRSDHYKGMPGDEVVGIYKEQEKQRRDRETVRSELQKDDMDWAAYDQACLRAGMAMEREAERKSQDARVKIAEAQKQDAKLAETRRRHMDEVFKNEITPDFFAQFGTSAR